MTTENGLTRPSVAYSYIQRIQRRQYFLEWRIRAIEQDPHDTRDPHFDIAELAAIRWAIPVLEAEWMNLVRMNNEYRNLPDSSFAAQEKALYRRTRNDKSEVQNPAKSHAETKETAS